MKLLLELISLDVESLVVSRYRRRPLQALGMSFFASTKPVKIDPELSMLVKHLISNGYAEFKIRLISAKASV